MPDDDYEPVRTDSQRIADLERRVAALEGRSIPETWTTTASQNALNCPRCGGLWISIPRRGMHHVCPDGGKPTQEDWNKRLADNG